MRGVRALLWAAGMWLGMGVAAAGCMCGLPSSNCGAMHPGDATFVGQVLGVREIVREDPGDAARRRVFQFLVVESFSGEQPVGAQIEVETGLGGGDCGYPFVVGGRYLVDANVV